MEKLLLEFVDTLDISFKRLQQELGERAGFEDLTVSQLQYIETIHGLQTPTVTEIAAALGYSKASVTTAVQQLERRGFLRRERSEADRRMVYLYLTERAAGLVQTKKAALAGYGRFIRSSLTREEARQFSHIMRKLVTLFNDEALASAEILPAIKGNENADYNVDHRQQG